MRSAFITKIFARRRSVLHIDNDLPEVSLERDDSDLGSTPEIAQAEMHLARRDGLLAQKAK
jgi:hypothetical protein